jgi:pseudouridine kinase
MPRPILAIGGAVVDRTYLCTHPPAFGTSNPVASTRSFGGVARNVAESLGRLGANVQLISAVGEDEAGRALVAGLAAAGVDTRGLLTVAGKPTAEYTAAFWQGELFAGFADMDVFEALTPQAVAAHLPQDTAEWQVFADCNLPAATLAMFAGRRLPHLAVDCVSLAKSERLPADLSGIRMLFLNQDQARHHGGIDNVLARGCRAAVLTQGPDGVTIFEHGASTDLPAPLVPLVNVSGAGDALVAGTLLGLSEDRPLTESVRFGLAAAALALQTVATVPAGLTRDKLNAALTGLLHDH